MKDLFYKALALVLIIFLGYLSYVSIFWLMDYLKTANSDVIVALVTAASTILVSVYIASYNSRKAKESIAFEAHRERKAEIYNDFMKRVIEIMRKTKAGKQGDDVLPDDLEEFFYSFTSKIVVYGGPKAVKAYSKWRSATKASDTLGLIDELFLEMRADLGESNRGFAKKDLIGLFIRKESEAEDSINKDT